MDKIEIQFEIYKRIYKSRDLELNFFWQRAVFLSAFLFVCFTAYGTFQMKLFNVSCGEISYIGSNITNFISIFICFCGYITSCLWVLMSKGSKNSYEAYEKMLNDFIEIQVNYDNKCNSDKNIKKEFFLPANLNTQNKTDSFLGGYRYSLSKINIFLGYFSMLIFFILSIIHIIMIENISIIYIVMKENICLITALLLLFYIFYILLSYCLKSVNKENKIICIP